MNISIINGHIVDPANDIDRIDDLHIRDGQIIDIGATPVGFSAEQRIDAKGKLVIPGLVDLSARLREPGYEYKATLLSETRAAVSAGITTLACPPDTDPVIDTAAVVKLIRLRSENAAQARVVCIGAATQELEGKLLSEMGALKAAGCVAISNGYAPFKDHQVQKRMMEYAATFGMTIFLHSEDENLAAGGCMHEGAISTRLGLPGIPEAAETVAVARDLALIADTGVRAHFCRLSSAKAVQMVGRAQFDGLPVTMDVAAHQLFLTDMDVGEFNSQCHLRPPLRGQRDMQGMRQSLLRGAISAICSDHQPHEADAKLLPFRETETGISALETLLPLTLRLVDEVGLSLSSAIAKVTCAPAQILGLEAGTLGIGRNADVTIVDPEQYWELSKDSIQSRGHNTPFLGWELKGRVTHTLVGGELIYQLNGE